MPSEDERQKGRFLTDTQQDYLNGSHDPPSDNAEVQLRSKIRDRMVGAMVELAHAGTNLGHRDRGLLYDNHTDVEFSERFGEYHRFPEEFPGRWGDLGFVHHAGLITGFFYKTMRENGYPRASALSILERVVEQTEHEVRNEFEHGEGWVEEGLRAVDVAADFRVKTVGEVDLDLAEDRLESGTELSGLEVKALVDAGHAEVRPTDPTT